MQQRSVLTRTTRPQVEQTTRIYRWMRYFFTEDISPDNRSIVDLQRRAVWIGLALILQSLNQIDQSLNAIERNWYLPFLVLFGSLLPLVLILGSFFAMWMAFRPVNLRQRTHYAQARQHPTRWQCAILIMTLLLSIAGSITCGNTIVRSFRPPMFTNDGTALDTNAAILLLQGRNPYTDSRILDVARRFPIQSNWTTPLRQGQFADRLDYPSIAEFQSTFDKALKSGEAPEFESKVSYPALSFLSLLPFVFFQNYNVLLFYLLSYLLIVAIAWKMARPELRPWILLLAMANIPMWVSTFGGNLDIFSTLLIILAWIQRGHRWNSALLLGLAVASKQTTWFFIPFYIIMVWRNESLKEAIYRVTIAGCLGLCINLPFLIWNPQMWLAGILAPIADPMFPLGVGIINLSTTHLLPYFPYWVYAVLEGCAMLGSLLWYWHHCRQHPEAAMLLTVLPLFFAWRSLPSYFYCAAYPIFVLIAANMKPTIRDTRVVSQTTPNAHWPQIVFSTVQYWASWRH